MNCAVYIDADNVSYRNLEEILYQSNNCNIIIKKIYADWTNENMKKWAARAKAFGFQGIQCFGNNYKQTSDIYMITDIINDIYTNQNIEMVVLATSDIDFTHLCHIIKAKNKKLLIFTPQKSNIESHSNIESNNKADIPEVKPKKKKKNKVKKNEQVEVDEKLIYLVTSMSDDQSLYISSFKKRLKEIVPKDQKIMDINHIDKELVKYPNHFKVVVKGNKIKIYGLFHLHGISEYQFKNNKEEIEKDFSELFKVINYDNAISLGKN